MTKLVENHKNSLNKHIIRIATIDDVEQINNIVNFYIKTSGANWSWHPSSLDETISWFKKHDSDIHPIYVACDLEGSVLGYTSLSHFREKDGYWPVAENSIYMKKNCIGLGIGNILMETILNHAKSSKLEVITSWIDSENIESIKFHEQWGFEIVGELKKIGDKFNTRRSVTIMQLSVL